MSLKIVGGSFVALSLCLSGVALANNDNDACTIHHVKAFITANEKPNNLAIEINGQKLHYNTGGEYPDIASVKDASGQCTWPVIKLTLADRPVGTIDVNQMINAPTSYQHNNLFLTMGQSQKPGDPGSFQCKAGTLIPTTAISSTMKDLYFCSDGIS